MMATLALLMATASHGLAVGENVAPFEPYWVSGPYADTRQCPICEYGLLPLVIVWTQLKQPAKLMPIIKSINGVIASAPEGRQKAFLVDVNSVAGDAKSRETLKSLSDAWKTPNVYFLSRVASTKAVVNDYKLKPYDQWETIVYVAKNRAVTAKFVDPKPEDLPKITEAIEASR